MNKKQVKKDYIGACELMAHKARAYPGFCSQCEKKGKKNNYINVK